MKSAVFDLTNTLFTYDFATAKKEIWKLVRGIKAVEKAGFAKFFDVYERNYAKYQGKEFLDDTSFFSSIFTELNTDVSPAKISGISGRHLKVRGRFMKAHKDLDKVLSELKKRGYKLGLLSNGVKSWGERDFQTLCFDTKKYFSNVLFSQECGFMKPDIKVFALILYEMDSPAKETFFIGDDYETDIAGAKDAGMKTIFLNRKGIKKFEKADFEIKKLKEVLKILK